MDLANIIGEKSLNVALKLSRLQAGRHLGLGDLLVEGDAVVGKQRIGLLVLHVRPGTFKGLVAVVVVYSHLQQKTDKFDSLTLVLNSFFFFFLQKPHTIMPDGFLYLSLNCA